MIAGVITHLWQSTLFAGAAWLVALALRRNRAQDRYWVWFAASAKFLIPFSLLVRLGTLVPNHASAAPIRTEWVATLQEFSQPLMPGVAANVAVHGETGHDYLAAAAMALWACGFLAVAICWLLRWTRVHALRKSARVVNVSTGVRIPVPVMVAADLIEPGIFGVLRPVLLLPEGILERLSQTQLDAILTHEFCHVRRKDNLTATIHMAVQAIFWFHPLTWWIGARLVDERERACDEEVLRLGCRPNDYAESVLMICKLYLSSPLACVSGVTGSDLKKRIESIMRNRSVVSLNVGKKLALGLAGMLTLAGPIAIGILHAPAIRAQDTTDWQTKAGGKMTFDVASVKLSTEKEFVPPSMPFDAGDRYNPTGGYFRADFPLWSYIQFAYKLWAPAEDQQKEIARLPKWVTTDRYSIEARAAGKPSKDQFRLMVQSLLADRVKLAAHFETREANALALSLVKPGKLGPKLIPHGEGRACGDPAAQIGSVPAGLLGGQDDAGPGNYPPMCDSFVLIRRANGTRLGGYRNATMDQLAGSLSAITGLGRTLVDRTGLSGRFDFTLDWAPEPAAAPPSGTPAAPPDPLGPAPVLALRDQLGLKLEPAKAPVKILVIDRVERPTEN
jgi:bla regulator protein BlaR1